MAKKSAKSMEKKIEKSIEKGLGKACEPKSSCSCGCCSGAVYGLGFVGAAIYYISTATGFCARQVESNDPTSALVLTINHHLDGTTVARVALRSEYLDSPQSELLLADYEHGLEFLEKSRRAGFGNARWIDLNLLLLVLTGFMRKHNEFLTTSRRASRTRLRSR